MIFISSTDFFIGNIKPVMTHMINFMRDEGIEKIALLGIAW
jgi:hypothetical protein